MINRYGGERFKKGLWHFGLGKIVSAISGFFAVVIIVRLLPISEFAHYSVLTSLVEIFTAFSALGLSHALLRYVPQLYAKRYKNALKTFVLNAVFLRTGVLLLIIGMAYIWVEPFATMINMATFTQALKLYLLVVLLRTTAHFLSQVLESTLHQSIVQFSFSIAALLRLVGMLYLTHLEGAGLIEVIWVEIVSDLVSLIVLSVGVFNLLRKKSLTSNPPADDQSWLKTNFRQIKHLAFTGYVQHIVGLPFGSNTNRLVGGYLFPSQTMANFGYAQLFYEYIKRYLPAQLLVGLIRPVVIARFSHGRDFAAAAKTCEGIVFVNIAIIGAILTALIVGGEQILLLISAGKYGLDALWVLIALMFVLTFETHRLILEMLVQTVERYAILIPSNIILALSIVPAIIFFPVLGAIGFPIMNAVTLLACNFLVKKNLASEGYFISSDLNSIFKLSGLTIIASSIGFLLEFNGLSWIFATILSVIIFSSGVWAVFNRRIKSLVYDLLGKETDIVGR